MKIKWGLFVGCVLIILISLTAYAHPGRTDANGGHYDHSTGEYHYHQGYPAHQHIGGVCPYDYDDQTNHNSNNSNHSQFTTPYPSLNSDNIIMNTSPTHIHTEKNINNSRDSAQQSSSDGIIDLFISFCGIFFLLLFCLGVAMIVIAGFIDGKSTKISSYNLFKYGILRVSFVIVLAFSLSFIFIAIEFYL